MIEDLAALLSLSPDPAGTARRLLVISPHLDDGVLSCGGAILLARRAGWEVEVCTVFSRSSSDEESEQRMVEDVLALGILGASPRWLGVPDKLARAGGRLAFEELFFADDRQAGALARAALAPVLAEPADVVLAPLAVGGHVDHLAVHQAVRERTRTGVWFYEDRPYATLEPLVRLRLSELGCRPQDEGTTSGQVLDALRHAGFVGRHFPEGKHRLDVLGAAIESAARPRKPIVRARRGWLRLLDEPDQWVLFRAQRAYASQRRAISPGRRDFDCRFRDVSRRITGRPDPGYVEQCWSLAPGC